MISPTSPSAQTKDDGASKASRLRGNVSFAKKDMSAAKCHYDLAVLLATDPSECQAMALGNRSAVSYESSHYEDAINDIQRALRARPKDTNLKTGLERRLTSAELAWAQQQAIQSAPLKVQDLYGGRHSHVSFLANAVKVQEVPCKGRGIVAKKNITAGSLLLREPSFVAALPRAMQTLACTNCCKLLPPSWIACSHCAESNTRYCDETCRTQDGLIHQFECQQMDNGTLDKLDMDQTLNTQLVRRVVMRFGVAVIIKWAAANSDTKSTNPLFGCKDTDKFVQNGTSLFSLCTYSSPPLDNTAITHLLPNSFLAHTDWADTPKPDRLAILSRFWTHISGIIRCNSWCLQPTWRSDNNQSVADALDALNNGKLVQARAIYASLSLFNHSCLPNTCAVFNGSLVELRATKDIAEGEELFVSYDQMEFGDVPRAARLKHLLEEYKFECGCSACVEEQYLVMEQDVYALKCSHCAASCRKCPQDGPALIQSDGISTKCRCCAIVSQFDQSSLNGQIRAYKEMLSQVSERDKTYLQEVKRSLAAIERVLYTDNQTLNELRQLTASTVQSVDPSLTVLIQQNVLSSRERYHGTHSPQYCATLMELVLAYSQIEGDVERWTKLSKQLIDLSVKQYGRIGARDIFTQRYAQFGQDYYDGVVLMFTR